MKPGKSFEICNNLFYQKYSWYNFDIYRENDGLKALPDDCKIFKIQCSLQCVYFSGDKC